MAWYRQRGFTILHKNWRSGRFEIDLIASKADILYFIEVKTRMGEGTAGPEASVGKAKLTQLRYGAEAYLFAHPEWKKIQFDVMAVTLMPNGGTELIQFPDVM